LQVKINPYTLRFNLRMPEREKTPNALTKHVSRAFSALDSLGPVREPSLSEEEGDDSRKNTANNYERADTFLDEYEAPNGEGDIRKPKERKNSFDDYVVRMKLTVNDMENSFIAGNDLKCLSQQRKILRVVEFFTVIVFIYFCFIESGEINVLYHNDDFLNFICNMFPAFDTLDFLALMVLQLTILSLKYFPLFKNHSQMVNSETVLAVVFLIRDFSCRCLSSF
jgi:hypothetical protein